MVKVAHVMGSKNGDDRCELGYFLVKLRQRGGITRFKNTHCYRKIISLPKNYIGEMKSPGNVPKACGFGSRIALAVCASSSG